ncbi:MAG TPA: SDR family oxidoreductase [Burkholderiales bacterium]|jgi:NAD(P)-dependent dehydrogenase (short-subunit alcohol dehydrogenase family)|nr:SDR family oxidoreductase [Burkholderiales bacterium]
MSNRQHRARPLLGAELFAAPAHDYTRSLLDAILLPDLDPDSVSRGAECEQHEEGKETGGMKIEAAVALVTGSSRGIGRNFVKALIARGAKKVYASARDASKVADLVAAYPGKVVALQLDITNDAQVAAAAKTCKDVTLLVNNAGINLKTGIIAGKSTDNARAEFNTNFFGTCAMTRAFAPVLGANGGGAIVNMLSILGRVSLPAYGSYCASKAACLLMTQGVRAELAKQGTLVVGVMPGATDTDVERDYKGHKENPYDVAIAALAAVESGTEDAYPGQMAGGVSAGLAADPKAVEKEFSAYLPG